MTAIVKGPQNLNKYKIDIVSASFYKIKRMLIATTLCLSILKVQMQPLFYVVIIAPLK